MDFARERVRLLGLHLPLPSVRIVRHFGDAAHGADGNAGRGERFHDVGYAALGAPAFQQTAALVAATDGGVDRFGGRTGRSASRVDDLHEPSGHVAPGGENDHPAILGAVGAARVPPK